MHNYIPKTLEEYFLATLSKKDINIVFQPIICLKTGDVFAYEALARGPVNSSLESPFTLFSLANSLEKVAELDYLCRFKALEKFLSLQSDKLLFVNMNPEVINDDFHLIHWQDQEALKGIKPNQIVIEITEHSSFHDLQAAYNFLKKYTSRGYRFAIDDMGSGYAGLNMLANIKPRFLKIDLELVKAVEKDITRQNLISTIVNFAYLMGITVIAEGIESREELNTLVRLGIEYGQGYYLQPPSPELTILSEEKKKLFRLKEGATVNKGKVGHSLEDIALFDEQVDPESSLVIQADVPIEIAASLAMNRPQKKAFDDVIIKKTDGQKGKLKIRDLIKALSRKIELASCQYLHPLTGLAGNLVIKSQTSRVIEEEKEYSVLYVDIDNFKLCNQVFGLEEGNKIIQAVSNFLKRIFTEHNYEKPFVCHSRADQFIVIVSQHLKAWDCQKVLEAFVQDKHIPVNLSLRLVLVTNENKNFTNQQEIFNLVRKLKKSNQVYVMRKLFDPSV